MAAALNGTTSALTELYAGTDFSALNWFEQQWVAWYIYIGNPIVATGLMSFLLHEIVYFGRSIPWIIIDATPYFRKWKLQPNKIPTPAEQWACTKQVLFSHFTIELPAVRVSSSQLKSMQSFTFGSDLAFPPYAESFGMKTYQVPFPSLKTMAPQIFLFFFFEDFFHFVAHQALHTGVLYKHIHKIHHKYSAPFGLAAEYAHPAEVFILGAGTILGPILYCYFTQNLHIAMTSPGRCTTLFPSGPAPSTTTSTTWPSPTTSRPPSVGGTGSFGTDTKYREYRARVKAAKKAMSKEQQLEFERKLMAQVEAEGIVAEAEAEKMSLLGGNKKSKVQ
ncbi:hypothetical protein NLJ89_g7584 [Agrocybe chaxingu]|uniref:Fatty acid hydroxylase domain-containing protein n=1 Tax=Agrocybe chaxingu TaxID=84603 RepID=A0A9W8JWI3_9AGAR|nr:hypothetical protein NLJ89_g7584 [Agrocybe chaxingu]